MVDRLTQMRGSASTAVRAGVAYFAIIFAAGFLLGILRVLALVPTVGELSAILLELPLMLVLSRIVSGWLIDQFQVPRRLAPRLIMGGLAFMTLMLGELGISTVALGHSVGEFFFRYRQLSALLGLAGQVAFAMFSIVQLAIRR